MKGRKNCEEHGIRVNSTTCQRDQAENPIQKLGSNQKNPVTPENLEEIMNGLHEIGRKGKVTEKGRAGIQEGNTKDGPKRENAPALKTRGERDAWRRSGKKRHDRRKGRKTTLSGPVARSWWELWRAGVHLTKSHLKVQLPKLASALRQNENTQRNLASFW